MTASEFKNYILSAYGVMLAVAKRMLHDNDDACDAVQDVLRGLWERRDRLRLPDNPRAFVMRCVRNHCIDILRHPYGSLSLSSIQLTAVAEPVNMEREIEFEKLLEEVYRVIDRLPDTRKEILKLNIGGMSAKEISEELGLTEANVRQLLSRTRKQIREKILSGK